MYAFFVLHREFVDVVVIVVVVAAALVVDIIDIFTCKIAFQLTK